MVKYLNLEGLQYWTGKIKALISVKADTTTVNAALAEKASVTALNEGLAEKASTTQLTEGLAGKADTSVVNAALAEKASTVQLTEGLAAKADTTTVNAALAEKATTVALNEGLAAKADKETVNAALAEKANSATTLEGYGIANAYTQTQTDAKIAAAISANNETIKEEVNAKLSSVYVFKGSVANYAALPTEGIEVGHVYNIEAGDATHSINAGDNVAWDGSKWDKLAGTITFDTSDLLPIDSVITNGEIDGLFVEA